MPRGGEPGSNTSNRVVGFWRVSYSEVNAYQDPQTAPPVGQWIPRCTPPVLLGGGGQGSFLLRFSIKIRLEGLRGSPFGCHYRLSFLRVDVRLNIRELRGQHAGFHFLFAHRPRRGFLNSNIEETAPLTKTKGYHFIVGNHIMIMPLFAVNMSSSLIMFCLFLSLSFLVISF